jgi:hypothetical protein
VVILVRLIAWIIIGGVFLMLLSMSDRMTWVEGLFAGFLAGAISGLLMRLLRDYEESEWDND